MATYYSLSVLFDILRCESMQCCSVLLLVSSGAFEVHDNFVRGQYPVRRYRLKIVSRALRLTPIVGMYPQCNSCWSANDGLPVFRLFRPVSQGDPAHAEADALERICLRPSTLGSTSVRATSAATSESMGAAKAQQL